MNANLPKSGTYCCRVLLMMADPWVQRMLAAADSRDKYMALARVLNDIRTLDGESLPDIAKKMQNYLLNGNFNAGWENGVRKYSWQGYEE